MSTAPETEDIAEQGSSEQETEESLGTTSELEKLGPCKLKVKAEVPVEKVKELLDRNYKDLISTLQLPGFRRGRVPRALVEKRYGEEIEKDLKEALLNDSFLEVIKEHELKVVGKPKFDNVHFETKDPFRYEVLVETRPEFEIEKYKRIEVTRNPITVEEKDIVAELDELRKRHGARVPIALDKAGPSDMIYGSYTYREGGPEGEVIHTVEEAIFSPEDALLDELAIPELAQVFNERADKDVLTFNVKIPDNDPREHFRDKDVTIELKLEDAKTVQLPDLDDEFAKSLQSESLEQLREAVSENLKVQKQGNEDSRLQTEIIETIEKTVEFDIPEGLLEEQKRVHKLRTQYQLLQMGRSKEEVEAELNKEDSPAEEEIRKEIKRHFILEKIAEKEKIFATEEDVRQRIMLYAQVYGKNPHDLAHELEESGRIEEMRMEIRQAKVRKLLLDKATILGENGKDGDTSAAESEDETTKKDEAATDAADS